MLKKIPFINQIVLLALASALVVWSFVQFGADASTEGNEWTLEKNLSFDEWVAADQALSAVRHARDSVTLLPGASARLDWDEAERHLTVELEEGAVLFAAEAGDFSVSVLTDFVQVDSQNSSAYVELDTETASLNVAAMNHPSRVQFLKDGLMLNSLLVPSEQRMRVDAAKVTSTIGKLRLTKLVKEFPTYLLEENDLNASVWKEWSHQESIYEDHALSTLTEIQSYGELGPSLKGLSAQVDGALNALKDSLTVLDHAEMRQDQALQAKALDYAMSHALFGSQNDMESWLDVWASFDHDLESVRAHYSDLFFVLPGDDLYPVKTAMAEVLYAEDDSITSLRRQFQDIESLLARASNVAAETAFSDYRVQFQSALDSGIFDDPSHLADISREYMLVELLLRRHSVFYNTEDAALLTALEEKILTLAGSDQDLDEERQAFVQSKIRFLENLFDYVVERKVDVDTATRLGEDLLFSAETHLNAIGTKVAVHVYFESLLEQYDLSLQYIQSPEFDPSDDFDAGLEAYQDKVNDLADLQAYIQELRQGSEEEVSSISFEAAVAQVETALRSAGIQYSGLEALEDNDFRLFSLNGARVLGYEFEANYDRETQILYDVELAGLRFSAGIKLNDFRTVVERALEASVESEDIDESEDTTQSTSSSYTNSVAIQSAESAFSAEDLDPDDFEFIVVDANAKLFTFEGIVGPYSIPVSGSFQLTTGKVSEVVWDFQGTPKTLPDLKLELFEPALTESYRALLSSQ